MTLHLHRAYDHGGSTAGARNTKFKDKPRGDLRQQTKKHNMYV